MADAFDKMPDTVKRAVWLLWASLILGILSSIPWAFEPLPPEMPKWFTWSLMLFTFGLSAMLIFFTSRRHNWARMVNFVFYIFGILSTFWDAASFFNGPVYAWSISLTTMLMDAVAFYWLLTGEGAAWFNRSRAD